MLLQECEVRDSPVLKQIASRFGSRSEFPPKIAVLVSLDEDADRSSNEAVTTGAASGQTLLDIGIHHR